MSSVYTTDFLIIGSGIAGLFTALKLSELGKVTIITKTVKYESNSSYAQGGVASVFSVDDNLQSHISDTLKAGSGLCDREAVEVLVQEGPDLVRELFSMGVPFDLNKDGNFSLSKEGGHSYNRVVHVADQTGKEIKNILLNKVKDLNIPILEHHFLVDLITPHHIKNSTKKNSCYGAYILDNNTGEIICFVAKNTILATGGAGQIYLHTTNPKISTGDGIACAYRAGSSVRNMEFYQFHPTFFSNSKNSFLVSEAVRGEGAFLENGKGFRFMKDHHLSMELAPRDIVARAIDFEMKKNGEQSVYLNLTHLKKEIIKTKFPFIKSQCQKAGFDILNERIPVVPAAHYMCGGIISDFYGRTSTENLFVVGEVSSTGIHGANRLASNSLLECVVFANRIYQFLKKEKITFPSDINKIPHWDKSRVSHNDELVLILENIREIQSIMSHYVGIVRSDLRLKRAEKRINLIFNEVLEFYNRTKITVELLELRNLVYTASLVIRSAQNRKESRGLHYNTDYKENISDSREDTILQSSQFLNF